MMNKCLPLLILVLIAVPAADSTADSIETAGDVLNIALPAGALVYSLATKDKEGAWQMTKTLGVANAVTYTLKPLVNEERPNGGDYSFPSGHATNAFSGAGYIQRRYGWTFGLPAYLLAGFVGYSRVESDNHYWYDALAGAAVGVGSAVIFTTKKDNVEVVPYADAHTTGLALKFRL